MNHLQAAGFLSCCFILEQLGNLDNFAEIAAGRELLAVAIEKAVRATHSSDDVSLPESLDQDVSRLNDIVKRDKSSDPVSLMGDPGAERLALVGQLVGGEDTCPDQSRGTECPACMFYVLRALGDATAMANAMFENVLRPPFDEAWRNSVTVEVSYCLEGTDPQIFDFGTSTRQTASDEQFTIHLDFSPFIKEPGDLEMQYWGMTFRLFHELTSHVYAHRLGGYARTDPTRKLARGEGSHYDVFFEGWMLCAQELAFDRLLSAVPGLTPDRQSLLRRGKRQAIAKAHETGYMTSMVNQGLSARAGPAGYDVAQRFLEELERVTGYSFGSEEHYGIFERMSAEIVATHWEEFDHADLSRLLTKAVVKKEHSKLQQAINKGLGSVDRIDLPAFYEGLRA